MEGETRLCGGTTPRMAGHDRHEALLRLGFKWHRQV